MNESLKEYLSLLPNRLSATVTVSAERLLMDKDVKNYLRRLACRDVAEKVNDKLSWEAEWNSSNNGKIFRGFCYCFSPEEFSEFVNKIYSQGKTDGRDEIDLFVALRNAHQPCPNCKIQINGDDHEPNKTP